jgi:hypothetical protein
MEAELETFDSEVLHDFDDDNFDSELELLAFMSKKSSDPDTMYMHQALRQPD